MEDIARMAKVSRTTVSFVLNDRKEMKISEATRKKVMDITNKLDYSPHAIAKSLVKGKTKTIGLVFCQQLRNIFSDVLIPQVLLGVSEITLEKDYKILFQYIGESEGKSTYYQLAREKRIDGIILSGPRSNDEDLVRLKNEDFPIVLMGQIEKGNFSCSDIDNVKAAKEIVSHLILQHGHKRIAMITNAPLNYTASKFRLQGYREALSENSIKYDRELVGIGNFTPQSGYEVMRKLLSSKNMPTAVFVASDVVAFGAMGAIKEKGIRIPEDIALVGFDNVDMSKYVDPPLTTVNLPAFEIGKNVASLIIDIIEKNEVKSKEIILDTDLVVRKSCGCNVV